MRLVSLCLTLWVSTHSLAKGSEFWILTNPEPPLTTINPRGELGGYAVELVQNILREADIEQQILTAPWKRVEKEARTKANVLVFALAKTSEREANYHWITPITANVYGLFSLNSYNQKLDSIADVNQLGSIGVLQRDARANLLRSNGVTNIQEYPSWEKTLEALLAGKVNNVFFSDAGVAVLCRQMKADCTAIKRVFKYETVTSYLVLSKAGTDAKLVSRLRDAAARYKASKDFDVFKNKWLAQYKKTAGLPMHADNGVLNLWAPRTSKE